ncbi:MAG: hypothetical protein KKC05_03480, partial [Nanoarchaeota archaeon]|nr:hypothetical protein [Nanoarchaeota archaeon]
MRQLILPIIIVSLCMTFIPVVSATHSITVSDANGNMVATQSNPISVCPKPLTPQDFLITVKNTGSIVDTYTVDVTLPSGWDLGTIRSGFSLQPGQTGEINPFLISYIPSNTLPGVYKVDVMITSSNKPSDKVIKSVYIEILSCHSIDIVSVDASRSVCGEDVIEETYQLEIKNNGKYREVLDLTSSVSWSSMIDTVELNPGETKDVDVALTPPAGLIGKQNAVVTATARGSYAEVSETLALDIKSCYQATVSIAPASKNVCFGESAEYELKLVNTGK